jgi:hypothetical protein
MKAKDWMVNFCFDNQSAVQNAPSTWPPANDWPVVVDEKGSAISRWSDSIWCLDKWAGKRCVLNFGDGAQGRASPIDKANADLLRQVTAWWMYRGELCSAKTILTRFSSIRPIFALCSREGILASELSRFVLVADKLPEVVMPSAGEQIVSLLHELLAHKKQLGFEILDSRGIAKFAAGLPDTQRSQTPYIPPRIWKYQVNRLKACLEDFLEHKESFKALFQFSLKAYIHNYGSLEAAFAPDRNSNLRPFVTSFKGQTRNGRFTPGSFAETAERYNVLHVIQKWVLNTDAENANLLHIDHLSSYFNMVSWVGLGYLLNFTLMRSDEAVNLKRGCLHIERDPRFGNFYLIEGATSKTLKDNKVHWVTSESAAIAVEAMEAISEMREQCLINWSGPSWLLHLSTEPWASGVRVINQENRPRPRTYSWLMKQYPSLFDNQELTISASDLATARLATPSLDSEFEEGKVWPLAWHQLRRTGAVNMQASGIVSDASLQFQLKHLSRAMSLYYGQNHAQIKLEETAKSAYVRQMYESIGQELQRLVSDRFSSPHGTRRKEEIVRLISVSDLKKSVQLAAKGGVACREIVLGVCMNKEPCPYGGIESIAHCGGGDSGTPCADVLYDTKKLATVKRLDKLLTEQLEKYPSDGPLRESLLAQKRSAQSYFDTINSKNESES